MRPEKAGFACHIKQALSERDAPGIDVDTAPLRPLLDKHRRAGVELCRQFRIGPRAKYRRGLRIRIDTRDLARRQCETALVLRELRRIREEESEGRLIRWSHTENTEFHTAIDRRE